MIALDKGCLPVLLCVRTLFYGAWRLLFRVCKLIPRAKTPPALCSIRKIQAMLAAARCPALAGKCGLWQIPSTNETEGAP